MLAGGDIAFIVGKLQAPPFGHSGLTGPALGEMRPERLLQLVSDAFASVAPVVGTRDVSSEDPDRTARRLVDFLRHVKYPAASDDPATLARWRDADVDLVFPALRWVLEHQDRCAKRAHAAHTSASRTAGTPATHTPTSGTSKAFGSRSERSRRRRVCSIVR